MTRKFAVLLTFVVTLFMAANASAQYAHIKNIVGSDHDLSSTGAGYQTTGFTEICFFCHIPHPVGTATANAAPLWNHQLSAVTTYGTYASPTFNTLKITITELGGAAANPGAAAVSNLCLSCHDGTVGINTLINIPAGNSLGLPHGVTNDPAMTSTYGGPCNTAGNGCQIWNGVWVGNTTSGNGLVSDHPINFTYDATLTAQVLNLQLPSAIGNGFSTGIYAGGTVLPLFTSTASGGMANTMQCATCHEVHDNTTAKPFLRMSNSQSALCLACHGA